MFRNRTATMIVALLVAITMLAVACQSAEEPAPAEEPTAVVEDTTEDATDTEDAESEDEAPAVEEEEPAEEPAAEEEEPVEEAPAEEEAEPVELTVWIYDSVADEGASIYDAVAAFEAENPNISVDLVPIQYGSSSFRDRYITAAQANAGPDVLMADIVWSPEFAAIGAALPIDDYLPEGKLDEYFPGPVDTLRYEGSVYGFPFYTNALAMFYNKDAFAEAGLPDPADGWTWDEFAEAVEVLTDGEGRYGYGLLGGWGGTFEWFPFLWSNGGQVLSDDMSQAAFNNEAGLGSVEFFMSIITSENVPEAAKAWQGWDELAAAFSNEIVAMYAVGDWGLNAVDGMEPDFEWGVAPLPVSEEPASVVGGANIMINSNTEHPEAAYALIEYLTGPVSFEMMDYYNRLSARRGNMDQQQIVQDDPRMEVFVESLEYARARPPIPNWTAVDWDCLQPAFQEILLNDAEIGPTMDEAEVCANEALGN
ncbi:MAG TPA: sugar ABC transporter substrate-binding protein [Candidatus Sulfomarinibacteraceae bacterium]|nr:sugar ABC transporter substrate-binding protein [Candidatus Sulfomarinibacteraceae bacterium]